MKKAVMIKDVSADFMGRACLYRLSEPLGGYETVVVSALTSAFDTGQPETYIFGADENGKVLDWGELDGSQRGTTDHALVLGFAGYEIQEVA